MISPTRLVARRARPQTPLLALALLLSTSPPAMALAPLCNQLITHSMTLTGDAACSSGGFVVGADGITIDLGGFTLSGDGGAGDIGIDVNGHDKVTIKHGTVRGFDVGIEADAAIGVVSEKLELSGVTVRDSTTKGSCSASRSSCSWGSVARRARRSPTRSVTARSRRCRLRLMKPSGMLPCAPRQHAAQRFFDLPS